MPSRGLQQGAAEIRAPSGTYQLPGSTGKLGQSKEDLGSTCI